MSVIELVSEELDNRIKVNNHSQTIYRQITPQGSSSVTLSATSSIGPTDVIISSSVFCPQKSRLNFQLTIATPGAGNYTWLNANALTLLSRVVLYDTNTSSLLLDISNFEKYASMVVPPSTSFEEFTTKASSRQDAYDPQILAATGAVSQLFPYEDIGKSNSLVNPTFDGANLASAALGCNSYMSRKQCFVGAVNSAVFVDFSIPFSAFKHSFLSVNRNVYSPSNLCLSLYWNSVDNFGWLGTSGTAPQTGAASHTGIASINNISVQIANEKNLEIISDTINSVMTSGLVLPIGYPTAIRTSLAAAGSHSYQISISRAYGSRILAILTSPFNVAATINLRNEHERADITSFNTFIDGTAIKYPNGYNTLLGQDFYYQNREHMKLSSVQSMGEYVKADYVWVDGFFGEKPLHMLDQTVTDGLDVTKSSVTWQLQATNSGTTAFIYVTVIIGQKTASFTSAGVMVN